jgi:hypothetical protein
MPPDAILILIPDKCKALAEAVLQLVTSVERPSAEPTATGRSNYAQIEREIRNHVEDELATGRVRAAR